MDIVVPIKFVPDLVEELEIDPHSGLLDRTFMRLIPSELDDHALEEALLLKERHGGTVTAMALDTGDVDEALYTALAKGADRAIKIVGDGLAGGVDNHAGSSILQRALENVSFDMILTGTQAVDDLDGTLGALLAGRLGLPYVGYVTRVRAEGRKLVVGKEYPGGLMADIEVALPAIVGIQAAEKPPRYVVTSVLMNTMKTATIDEMEAEEFPKEGTAPITRMSVPEASSHATMIEGNADDVADELVTLFRERGVLT